MMLGKETEKKGKGFLARFLGGHPKKTEKSPLLSLNQITLSLDSQRQNCHLRFH